MRLISNSSFVFILLILFNWSTRLVSGQESPVWNKSALKDSVTALLSKYETLHNQLSNKTDPFLVREFINLFPNPRVQVINDLEDQMKPGQISIEEYISKLGVLFPDGLIIRLDRLRFSMDQPRYDRNNRYIIRLHVTRVLNGISKGRVFSSNRRIIIQVAFDYTNNVPDSFVFYGMELPKPGQSILAASYSQALTGFENSTVKSDGRLNMSRGTGYLAGMSYTRYFTDHTGIGSGVQFSRYSGSISLDSFDPVGSFNPNLRDVVIDNDLWFVEIPAFFSWRTNPAHRWGFRMDLGLSLGIRIYEEMASTAVNTNTGLTQVNVFSDDGWIDEMSRFNLGLQGSAAIRYRLNDRFGMLFGIGLRRGLTPLDSNIHADFVASKYLGQFNPLWGAPGKTANQAFFLQLGSSFILNKERN